jgi:ATP-dependent helicase YprA (DUF1998 family)
MSTPRPRRRSSRPVAAAPAAPTAPAAVPAAVPARAPLLTAPLPPVDATAPASRSFVDLGVPAALVAELARQGIGAPFPIQVATLPDTLAGRDVLGRGRTGSGKTLAFGLPLVARLCGGPAGRGRPVRWCWCRRVSSPTRCTPWSNRSPGPSG